jgi:SAM-dependent methyltransferase
VNSEDDALLALGRALMAANYKFTAVSPESHRRVMGRGQVEAQSLQDVFGWSRPFSDELLGADWLDLMREAAVLTPEGRLWRSRVRFATVGDRIFAHSAHPATAPDSVEIDADSYRFVSVLQGSSFRAERAVDLGCGAGIAGLVMSDRALTWTLADVNPRALRFSRINSALNGLTQVEFAHTDLLADVGGDLDLVICHPPHRIEPHGNLYRDGGGPYGVEVAVRTVKESLERLVPGGRLVLYTASPIVNGRDMLLQEVRPVFGAYDSRFEYLVLDPDMDSELLERPEYAQVDRIARVALSASTHDG